MSTFCIANHAHAKPLDHFRNSYTMDLAMRITLHAHTFTLSAPYVRGDIITAAEATALNARRAEIIRSRIAAKVRGPLRPEQIEQVQQMLTQEDHRFSFENLGDYSARPPSFDVELEQVVREHAEQHGIIDPQQIRQLKSHPVLREEANRRLALANEMVQEAIDELFGEDDKEDSSHVTR